MRNNYESGSSSEEADFVSKDTKREFMHMEEALVATQSEVVQWETAHPDKRCLIVIAGPSASGKSTFAERLNFAPQDTTVLSLDRYYLGAGVQEKSDGKVNFSIPSALDTERLRADVAAFLAANEGEEIKVPVYGMKESARIGEENIRVTKRLIIEGIYAIDQVDANTPFKIYVDVSEDTVLERKLHRDVKERGIPEETVRERFEQNVIPATREHVVPQRDRATIVVHNDPIK